MASKITSDERERRVRAKTSGSAARFARSQQVLAGGVSSGLRRHARPYPLFFAHGAGSTVTDVDGNSYLDYGLAWGPLILGHAPPPVVAALSRQAAKATTFGAQHDLEIEVAARLVEVLPGADLVCFANSGTEIVQVALRLARAVTGRPQYLKFEGHYHGWSDETLVSYKPTAAEIASRGHAPVPTGHGQIPAAHAVIAEWNNPASVLAAFDRAPGEIGALLCEPLLANSGCLPPAPGFLSFLREECTRRGVLLIFDEVITGFRLALGGAQEFYGVTPDLATFAKAVGAGTPLSVLAGRREFMDHIARGDVVHAGTLNGNPLALAAAQAALTELSRPGVYPTLHERGEHLRAGILACLQRQGLTACATGVGPVFQIHFFHREPSNYRDTLSHNRALYSDFLLALLDEGVIALPDGRWYLSTAHTATDLDETLHRIARAAASLNA